MSNEEIIISVYGDDIEGIFAPEDISNLNRLINLARTPPLPIQSDSGVEFGEWQICPVCNGTGQSMNHRNMIPLITDTCTRCNGEKTIERPSLKTKELEAEIERLKELIEKLYKSTGNRIMANMFDDNIDITWQQFKTEHNL